jgi:hypothetical protein
LLAAILLGGCQHHAAPIVRDEFSQQLRQVRLGQRDTIRVVDQFVSDQQLRQLGDLPQLRELILDNARVTDSGLACLSGLPGLEHLRIRGGRAGDEALRRLAQLRELRIVNLPDGEFTDAGLEALKSLPHLAQLRFGSPRVTDEGMRFIGEMSQLRSLHLIDVPITDAGLKYLAGMHQLESLYLDGAAVTDEGIVGLLECLDVHLHIDQMHHDRDPKKH